MNKDQDENAGGIIMRTWKKIIISAMAALGIACFAGGTVDAASVKIDETTFPNACVRTYARQQDKNNDGVLSEEEIKAVTKFDWTESVNITKCGVKPGMKINFKGMEVFTNLKEVKINSIFFMKEQMRRCWYLENDDILSQFPYAEYLALSNIENITLSPLNKNLKELVVYYDKLSVTAPITSVDKLTTFSTSLDGYSQDWGNCFPNAKKVSIALDDVQKEINGFKQLEQLEITGYNAGKTLNLSRYKDTLKRLQIGDTWEETQWACYAPDYINSLTTLDISSMKKLETVEACTVSSLERIILADSRGKSALNNLKTLHITNNKIKKLDLAAAANIEEVFVGGKLSEINVNRCKKLQKLLINSNSLKKLTIKNKSLKHLEIKSTQLGKINVGGCTNLIGLKISGKQKRSIAKLDLSKNRKLVYLRMYDKKKCSAVILPKVSTPSKFNTLYEPKENRSIKCDYWVPAVKVDVSKYTRMPAKVKKYQIKSIIAQKYSKTKKLMINKKLRKADKKWIKKLAKKWKIKVVEKK